MRLIRGLSSLLLFWISGCDPPISSPSGVSTPSRSSDPDPIFEDMAAAVGLRFRHQNGMSGEFYFCETVGPGAALFDSDQDGDLDLYLTQGHALGLDLPPPGPSDLRDRLFQNDLKTSETGPPILAFRDVTDASGVDGRGYGMGVTAGDFDNDGAIDLYVTNFGPNQLLHNRGDGSFSDETPASGTQDPRWSASAAFFDFDRDGWLDLFVCSYVDFRLENHKECYSPTSARDYCGPLSYAPTPDRLFRNQGDGSFRDVTVTSGIGREYGGALGVVCSDLNGDRWPDIYVANDGLANQAWINQKDGTFRNHALLGGCAYNRDGVAEASMGIEGADLDGDADVDLFVTHLRGETNTLYLNDGKGHFRDETDAWGLGLPSRPFTGFGVAALDFDNDGWLDLFVANGEVRTLEALARIGDPYPLHQINQLFRNLDGERFQEITAVAGRVFEMSEVSRGAAHGDIDNDGDIDIIVSNNHGPVRLLLNQVGNRRDWIGLRLVHGRHPRDAIGARVEIIRPGQPPLFREVRPGASYCSSVDPRIHVGLGSRSRITEVRVVWPDGSRESFPPPNLRAYTTLRMGKGRRVEDPPR